MDNRTEDSRVNTALEQRGAKIVKRVYIFVLLAGVLAAALVAGKTLMTCQDGPIGADLPTNVYCGTAEELTGRVFSSVMVFLVSLIPVLVVPILFNAATLLLSRMNGSNKTLYFGIRAALYRPNKVVRVASMIAIALWVVMLAVGMVSL